MTEKDNVTIPFYVHQAEMARERKHSKMLFVLCLVIFFMLILTNGAWIYYENRPQENVTSENNQTSRNIESQPVEIYWLGFFYFALVLVRVLSVTKHT